MKKAWSLVGWLYDGGLHCVACAKRSGMGSTSVCDFNGDEPTPIFKSDEEADGVCADCKEKLTEE